MTGTALAVLLWLVGAGAAQQTLPPRMQPALMGPRGASTRREAGTRPCDSYARGRLFLGVVTLILGLIVAFHPSGSLTVIAVLLGILLIAAGIFHLIRMFSAAGRRRVWLGISGLLLIVTGVLLIRHLHLTVAIIGLVIGISWIVQGLSALIDGASGGPREGRGWWIFFGIVSLAAGIVVTAVPVASVTALAVLAGIWFVVQGLLEIIGGLMLRHAITTSQATMVPPRAGEGAAALLRGSADQPGRTGGAGNRRITSAGNRGRAQPHPDHRGHADAHHPDGEDKRSRVRAGLAGRARRRRRDRRARGRQQFRGACNLGERAEDRAEGPAPAGCRPAVP